MDVGVFRKALVACATAFAFAAVIAGCGGSSSTPSSTATTTPTVPNAQETAIATAGSGPFALPAASGFSGTLNETVVSPGATHTSVPVAISDYAGAPSLPSGITLSTSNLNVFFSFAETFGSGTTGDNVSLGNPFATTLTLPSSFVTANVLFFSQLCYYTPSAPSASQFVCDASSVQSQSVNGTTLVDDNYGSQYPATTGANGIPTSSIPYGTTVYKLFFTVNPQTASPSPSPSGSATTAPLTTQATTVPLTVGAANFAAPAAGGITATIGETVTAIGGATSQTMLITTANGLPSPLPSGASFSVTTGTLFYSISQQVAPGAVPSSSPTPVPESVTFSSPFNVTLTVPAGLVPLSSEPVYSEVCYYYPLANPTFSCDANSQQIANVNASTGTIVDTNAGAGSPEWVLSSSGGQATAAQTYYATVYKFYYYPATTGASASRAPSLRVLRTK